MVGRGALPSEQGGTGRCFSGDPGERRGGRWISTPAGPRSDAPSIALVYALQSSVGFLCRHERDLDIAKQQGLRTGQTRRRLLAVQRGSGLPICAEAGGSAAGVAESDRRG